MEEKEAVQNVAEQQTESVTTTEKTNQPGGIFKNISGDLRVFLIALFTSIIVVIVFHLIPVKWIKGDCNQDSMCLLRVEERSERNCPHAAPEKKEKFERCEKHKPNRRPKRNKKSCPECRKRAQENADANNTDNAEK